VSRIEAVGAVVDRAWQTPPMLRRFSQVDVFTTVPYRGNPVAVVHDATGIDDDALLRFARWTNLSETTFLLPPTTAEADYRVRIFTPVSELPFAGHPTLGTCHAWLEAGGAAHDAASGVAHDLIVQECGAGLIRVRQSPDGVLAFEEPPLRRSGPVDAGTVDHIADVLRIPRAAIVDAQWADNGPGWVAVLLASAAEVLALEPGFVDLDLGVIGPYPEGVEAAFEVRAFFPLNGATVEDPATGSLNASLAGWLIRAGGAVAPWIVSQGTALGRAGRVHITQDEDGVIWTGGKSVTCIRGEVEL
jgi:PhzF family phenazine biosynthesis protein